MLGGNDGSEVQLFIYNAHTHPCLCVHTCEHRCTHTHRMHTPCPASRGARSGPMIGIGSRAVGEVNSNQRRDLSAQLWVTFPAQLTFYGGRGRKASAVMGRGSGFAETHAERLGSGRWSRSGHRSSAASVGRWGSPRAGPPSLGRALMSTVLMSAKERGQKRPSPAAPKSRLT